MKVLIFLVFWWKAFRFFFLHDKQGLNDKYAHDDSFWKVAGAVWKFWPNLFALFVRAGLVVHCNIHLLQPTKKDKKQRTVATKTVSDTMCSLKAETRICLLNAGNARARTKCSVWRKHCSLSEEAVVQKLHSDWPNSGIRHQQTDDCSCGFFGWFLCAKCADSLQHPQTCQHSLSVCGSAAQEAASSTAAAESALTYLCSKKTPWPWPWPGRSWERGCARLTRTRARPAAL